MENSAADSFLPPQYIQANTGRRRETSPSGGGGGHCHSVAVSFEPADRESAEPSSRAALLAELDRGGDVEVHTGSSHTTSDSSQNALGFAATRRRRGGETNHNHNHNGNAASYSNQPNSAMGGAQHYRPYRSTYYTNRLSFCFLFIFFLIAIGNLGGLWYYRQHKGDVAGGEKGGDITAVPVTASELVRSTDRPAVADPRPPPLSKPGGGDVEATNKKHSGLLERQLRFLISSATPTEREKGGLFPSLLQLGVPRPPTRSTFAEGFALPARGEQMETPSLPHYAALYRTWVQNVSLSAGEAIDLFDPDTVIQEADAFKSIKAYTHRGVLLRRSREAEAEAEERTQPWPLGALPGGTPVDLFRYVKKEQQLPAYNPAVHLYLTTVNFPANAAFCVPTETYKEQVLDALDAEAAAAAEKEGGHNQKDDGSKNTVDLVDMNLFSPSLDTACEKYLTNPDAWLALKPLSSDLRTGRTIKFLLSYRHHNTSAVLKLSQRGFVTEPAGEVAGYHMDRLLGVRRVPPTVLLELPVAYVQAAVASLDDPFYARWVEQWALGAASTAQARRPCRSAAVLAHYRAQFGEAPAAAAPQCVLVSAQVWLDGVAAVESSVLRHTLPMGGAPAKTRIVNQEVNVFRLPLGPPYAATARAAGAVAAQLTSRVNPYTTRVTLAAQKALTRDGMSAPNHTTWSLLLEYIAMAERFDNLVYDAVIGNMDRWLGHNLFATGKAAASDSDSGASDEEEEGEEMALVEAAPQMVYLDQGCGFVREGLSRANPFHALAFTALAASKRPTREEQRWANRRRVPVLGPLGVDDQDGPVDPTPPFCRQHHYLLARLERLAVFATSFDPEEPLVDRHARGGNRYAQLRRWLDPEAAENRDNSGAYLLSVWQGASPAAAWRLAQDPAGRTAAAEAQQVGQGLYDMLAFRLPERLGTLLQHAQLRAACRRVWSVLAQHQRCKERYTAEEMYF